MSSFVRRQSLTRPATLITLALMLLLAACQPAMPAAPVATDATAAEAPAAEATAEATASGETLVVYSGRSENLVGPLLEQFSQATGIQVEVRYGGTSELAATILEEGNNSPADIFFSQDAGALGALSKAGRLAPLPAEVLAQVPANLQSLQGFHQT